LLLALVEVGRIEQEAEVRLEFYIYKPQQYPALLLLLLEVEVLGLQLEVQLVALQVLAH
jgi:hypothetical protein